MSLYINGLLYGSGMNILLSGVRTDT